MIEYFPLTRLVKNIVLVDGISRTGKLLLGSLISSLDRMEHIEFGENFEYIIPAIKLKKLKLDFGHSYLNNYLNMLIYNKYISRNVNFRPNDITGIDRSKNPKIYYDRLETQEGDKIIKSIKKQKKFLPIVTHDIAVNLDILMKMKMNFKIIEIIRNPLDTVYSWYKRGLGSRFGNDQRIFTLLIKKNKKIYPWYNALNGFDKKKYNVCEKCVEYVINLNQYATSNLKNSYINKNVLITTYEKLTNNPLEELKRISNFLGTKTNKKTIEFIKREKLSLKKNFFEPRVKFDEKTNLIKKLCSKKIFEKLMLLNEQYEKNFYKLNLNK
tara:strand:+ start:1440 stop:2417 length:978 start_codon:yes stop_codon:yes gene_type:complete